MIRLDSISKQNGRRLLFVEASAALQRGERIGLVGPNGAGKTTLFRMITRQEEPDEGQILVDRGVSDRLLQPGRGRDGGPQRRRRGDGRRRRGRRGRRRARDAGGRAGGPGPGGQAGCELLERFGEVQARFEELGGYALEGKAREVLDGLGFSQGMMDGDVGALSGGWKMRVALARILLMRPDVMLLDEPSNHLDLESLIWLEQFLTGYDGALLMTSHDREFMNRVVNRIIEIDGGALTTFSGDYEFYERQRALNERQQQAQFETAAGDAGQGGRLHRALQGPRLARGAGAEPREEAGEDRPRRAAQAPPDALGFDFPPAPRSGEDVANLRGVGKRYGDRVIYDGLDLLVRRRERCCVLGVNGAGKSTLLRLVAGATEPDQGSVTLGGSVKLGYFAQHAMELLEGERTVFGTLEDAFPRAGQGPLRALAGGFGFSGNEIEKRCRVLSGGEKARLVMALMLFDPPNLLVLDEPTNHLDLATKEMLIGALSRFEGTMLFVSHDRRFLAALSNRVLELTPEGVRRYDGGYTEYVARTGREAPGLHV